MRGVAHERKFHIDGRTRVLAVFDLSPLQKFLHGVTELPNENATRWLASFEQSLAVSGFAQDEHGEIYVLGNRTGMATGTGGVILRIGPGDER